MHEQQTSNAERNMIPANKNSNHQISEDEKHLIHAQLRMVGRDQATGEYLHKPYVQTFYPNEFGLMDKEKAFRGLEVEIIHDPRSEAQIKADLENDGKPGTVTDGATAEKPITRMNKDELKAKYRELYEEEAPSDYTAEEIRNAIYEKIDFLEKENAGK